jgi:hypothetical protein
MKNEKKIINVTKKLLRDCVQQFQINKASLFSIMFLFYFLDQFKKVNELFPSEVTCRVKAFNWIL